MSRKPRGMPARPDLPADPLHPAGRQGTDDVRIAAAPGIGTPEFCASAAATLPPNGATTLNFRHAVPLRSSYARLLENH